MPSGDPNAPSSAPSDWELRQQEREGRESAVTLPALPRPGGLIEFSVSGTATFRFFIDGPSLSVTPGGVVRYTLVARSPSGYENVSYEGIHCKTNTYRVYAFAHGEAWSRAASDWKPIEPKTVQRWHQELRGRYFCPLRASIHSAAEGVDALRRGGHPLLPASSEFH